MKLQLTRPIAFIDLETTGINISTDRIVEVSALKILPGGEREIYTRRINPGVPIPTVVSKIHGIYDVHVFDQPHFQEVAQELNSFLEGCDFGGYNCNHFDIPLLVEEFLRAGVDFEIKNRSVVDVQAIFHKMEERTLTAAYRFYCNKELTNAHSAEGDVIATGEVLEAQLERYPQLQNDITYLSKFSSRRNLVDMVGRMVFDDKGREVFNFGKHKGKVVEDVLRSDPFYYNWMLNGDFPLHTKKMLTEIKNRMQPITNPSKREGSKVISK